MNVKRSETAARLQGREFMVSFRANRPAAHKIDLTSEYTFRIVGPATCFFIERRVLNKHGIKAYGPFDMESFPVSLHNMEFRVDDIFYRIQKDLPTHYRHGIKQMLKEKFGYGARAL